MTAMGKDVKDPTHPEKVYSTRSKSTVGHGNGCLKRFKDLREDDPYESLRQDLPSKYSVDYSKMSVFSPK